MRSPVALVSLVESVDISIESRADESFARARIVQEPDLERHHAFHSKVNLLDQGPLLPVVDVEVGAVVARSHVLDIQSFLEASGVSPLSADHDVMMRLVPKVVAKVSLVLGSFGVSSLDLKRLPVNHDEGAFSIALRSVSHAGDHNVAIAQTMRGVRNGRASSIHFRWLNHLS